METAGLVVIGNEILSGSVRDENIYYLATELRRMGVSLERVLVIPDDIDRIGQDVRELSEHFDVVITTGGVGPTHDDVTFAGVSRGFNVPLELYEDLARSIRQWYGKSFNEAVLKMAWLPEGSVVLDRPDIRFPPILYRNVFILPGIPSFLRAKFEVIAPYLVGVPIHKEVLYLGVGESEVASSMEAVARAYPDVSIGSYPLVDRLPVLGMVILESRDRQRLDAARKDLLKALPESSVIEASANNAASV